jgi:hypothetical protein
LVSATTQCTGSCNTDLMTSCNTVDTFRLCVVGPDCAGDPSNPDCCNLPIDAGVPLRACVSDLVKQFEQLTCF